MEKSTDYLREIVSDYKIFLDASVVLSEGFILFSENIKNIVHQDGKRVLLMLPSEENDILLQLQKEGKAKNNIASLIELHRAGMASPFEGKSKFRGLFDNLSTDIKVCILTQNKNVADAVSCDPNLKRFDGFVIRRVNRYGFLSAYHDEHFRYQYRKKKGIETEKKIVSIQNKRLLFCPLPKTGDSIKVGEQICILGEIVQHVVDGFIYDLGNGVFAKMYKQELCDTYHLEKCTHMIHHRIVDGQICWPSQLIFNLQNQFIGYAFSAYEGVSLQKAVLKKAGLNIYFPEWEKQQLVELAVTILTVIKHLHDYNVLIGCIDLTTIMVKDEKTVYFTEVDKMQIGGYPCLSRNSLFLPPEILPYKNKVFLFNEYTEKYEIAVLVFMLMMPGITPYAQRGRKAGSGKTREFPYPLGEIPSKKLPVGFWRFMWSHLDYHLKHALYNTFTNGAEYYVPQKRKTTEYWLKILRNYRDKLESGEFCKYDPHSALIYPDTFRKVKGITYVKCDYCGKEYPEWYMDKDFPIICRKCRNKRSDESFVCKTCGKTFYYSVKEALYHKKMQKEKGWKPQTHCSICGRKIKCLGCGEIYPAYKLKAGYCKSCNWKRERERR